MTPERFRSLVDAYGADPSKWPNDDRVRAFEHAATPQGTDVRTALADAAMLDDLLDDYVVAAPDRALMARIVASAPASTTREWFSHLWSGLGVAGVAAAGVLAGVMVVSSILPPVAQVSPPTELSYLTTAFSGSSPLWSEQ
jgi:hypothetical protein